MRNYYLLAAMLFFGCIDSIFLDEEKEVELLIVQGGVTTGDGPYMIKLTRSAKYGTVFDGVITNELGAKVFVRDDIGYTIQLEEGELGEYFTTEGFQGEVGRAYTLFIETSDGEEFQSLPEYLSPVPDIDSVYFEFVENPVVIDGDASAIVSGVDLFVAFSDSSEVDNYYRWATQGTFSFTSHPELYVPPLAQTPSPKECCEYCFQDEVISSISVESDRFFDGSIFDKNILFIEDDGFRFSEKYSVNVEQSSISKDAYEYYSLLVNQLEIKGNIFDPPPATIRGNMINLTNPDENVIGFFYASDVRTHRVDILGSDLPYVASVPQINNDCQVVIGSYRTTPEFW